MELSKVERIMLINQFEMLKQSEQDIYSEDYIERFIEILIDGYQNHYNEIFDFIREPMDKDRSEFILELFQMYDGISKVLNENPDEFDEDEKLKADFPGFDGNKPDRDYGYASFLGKHYNFYDLYESKGISEDDRRFGSFNSHGSEYLRNYEEMNTAYKDLMQEKEHWYLLNVEDVKMILSHA